MVWVRSPVYFYKRNETFYFSRAIPSDLLRRFNKRKFEVSLRTKSEVKALDLPLPCLIGLNGTGIAYGWR